MPKRYMYHYYRCHFRSINLVCEFKEDRSQLFVLRKRVSVIVREKKCIPRSPGVPRFSSISLLSCWFSLGLRTAFDLGAPSSQGAGDLEAQSWSPKDHTITDPPFDNAPKCIANALSVYLLLTNVILSKGGVKALIRFQRRPIVHFKSEKNNIQACSYCIQCWTKPEWIEGHMWPLAWKGVSSKLSKGGAVIVCSFRYYSTLCSDGFDALLETKTE